MDLSATQRRFGNWESYNFGMECKLKMRIIVVCLLIQWIVTVSLFAGVCRRRRCHHATCRCRYLPKWLSGSWAAIGVVVAAFTICAYRHSTGSVGDNSPYTLHNLAVVLACFMQSHAHTSLSHNQTTTETYETCILHDKTTNDKMFGGILSVFCGKINSLHRKYGIFICFSFKFVRWFVVHT